MFTHCDDYKSHFSEMRRLMEDGSRYYEVSDTTTVSYTHLTLPTKA